MSKIKNGGLDQCDAEAFDQQLFGTAGVEEVNTVVQMQPAYGPPSRRSCASFHDVLCVVHCVSNVYACSICVQLQRSCSLNIGSVQMPPSLTAGTATNLKRPRQEHASR